MKTAIIIGSGLGGLQCAYILARNGFKVTVLERHHVPGGCLQTFRRSSEGGSMLTFYTGFHYVGGLGPGQSLRRIFDYFGLMSLPWKQLDTDCFDEVVIGGKHYPFANGHEAFAQRLAEYFPCEKENLHRYVSVLKSVGDNIFRPFSDGGASMNELFSHSAYEFLCETISDPLLRQVLSGTALKMELSAEALPLYVFAQINDSFIRSAWRLEGGGEAIVNQLVESIRSMGGEVRTSSEVTALRESGGLITEVEANGCELLSADYVISDAHPALTLSLVSETKLLRRIYRSRIAGLKNTFGMFTANACLRPESLPYLNRNIYVHCPDADLWRPDPHRTESVLVHFYPETSPKGNATHLDLLSPMSYEELSQWQSLPIGHRGSEYEAIKDRKLQECIALAAEAVPGLEAAISKVYTSTPLTYQSYTASPQGSAYGIRKDCTSPMSTVLSPRSPIPNLLFTGQSLNLHGLLGVSMTSLMTCRAMGVYISSIERPL